MEVCLETEDPSQQVLLAVLLTPSGSPAAKICECHTVPEMFTATVELQHAWMHRLEPELRTARLNVPVPYIHISPLFIFTLKAH